MRGSTSTAGALAAGFTRNPYDLAWDPCGSSSGSAVAPAANLCAVAIGTETDGSIVCPSGSNAVVGLKPTVGLVAQDGIIPISPSQDTAGPMSRTVDRRGDRPERAALAVRRGRRRAAAARLPDVAPPGSVARRPDRRRSAAFLGRPGRGRCAQPRRRARVRDDARRSERPSSTRSSRSTRRLDRGRRADGPLQRVQGRAWPPTWRAARHGHAVAGRRHRLQRRALRGRAALLRAGAARRRRRHDRPGRPGLPRRASRCASRRPAPTASTGSWPTAASTRSSRLPTATRAAAASPATRSSRSRPA